MSKEPGLGRWIDAVVQPLKELFAAEPLPPGAPGAPLGPAAPGPSPARGPSNRYDPVRQAVDQALARFMASVQEHLEIAPDARYSVRYLQLAADGAEAQALVAAFFQEFNAPTLRRWAQDAVRRNCAHGVLIDGLLALRPEPGTTDSAEADPWNDQLAAGGPAGGPITLSIVGEWVEAVAETRAAAAAPPAAATPPAGSGEALSDVSQRQLTLEIQDARGSRQVGLTALPVLLGRASAGTAHAIEGRYLSRRHARLALDAHGAIVLHNLSDNGCLVDGQPLKAGASATLRNGAQVALGRTQDQLATAPQDCPLLRVRWAVDSPLDTPTPPVPTRGAGAPAVATDTPLWGAPAASGPLGLLAVQDAEGTRTCAVLRLPYSIGRDPAADCPVPAVHKNVSREHLRIQAIGEDGARLLNRGAGKGWGTAVDGVEQPAEFTLPWGASVTLASRDAAMPVRVQLLKPRP